MLLLACLARLVQLRSQRSIRYRIKDTFCEYARRRARKRDVLCCDTDATAGEAVDGEERDQEEDEGGYYKYAGWLRQFYAFRLACAAALVILPFLQLSGTLGQLTSTHSTMPAFEVVTYVTTILVRLWIPSNLFSFRFLPLTHNSLSPLVLGDLSLPLLSLFYSFSFSFFLSISSPANALLSPSLHFAVLSHLSQYLSCCFLSPVSIYRFTLTPPANTQNTVMGIRDSRVAH